jgi:Putative zinc-finger
MSCSSFDWKAFAVGDLTEAERRQAEIHLSECPTCREEAESLRLTVTALHRLPWVEPPRRIAFVSDPVIEPAWWERFWASGPKLGFASAALLAAAVITHGFLARPGGAETNVAQGTPAATEQVIQQEVARRLDAALDARLRDQLVPAMTELQKRIDEVEKNGLRKVRDEAERKRQADLRDIKDAFQFVERRLNVVHMSAAKFGGD